MPARGQYDRSLAPAARWAEHRAELVQAAADEIVEAGATVITVDRVVRRASRGRNTFYAHFRDVEQVLRAVEASVLSRVSAAVDAHLLERDAGDRCRALAN